MKNRGTGACHLPNTRQSGWTKVSLKEVQAIIALADRRKRRGRLSTGILLMSIFNCHDF
jgi:hypothetical protein